MRPIAAPGGRGTARTVTAVILLATVAQLLVATLVSDLPQFEGKGFGARLVAYPVLMLLVPAVWLVRQRVQPSGGGAPWVAFALVMSPFLVDVTGNTLDLYDSVVWWDDANHLVNWFLLLSGLGLLLPAGRIGGRWLLAALVTGLGAVLAIGWELAEWFAFIRHGTELATAYEDTLGDEALGTLGAALAGVVVTLVRSPRTAGRERM